MKSSLAKAGNVVITSALPYANGEIHLGHITSTYLPADILARYLRSTGHRVLFLCGSDDYGTPILIKAEQENKKPEDYVKFWNERDQKDFKKLGISFDIFHKTSSEENIKLAQHFFDVLGRKGFIFKKTVSQPYCEYDKKFLPDRYVKGTCPYCNAEEQYSDGCEKCGRVFEPGEIKNEHCALCKRTPVRKKSEHCFLRLSAFSDELRDWLLTNNNLQADVKNYVLKWIDEGLKEWDITRDIPWGVPVPNENNKVFYGWFDNAIGYASTAIKYFGGAEKAKQFWNSSKIYHYIGKDIVYHHYLFMTAIRLITNEFKAPDYIPTRGYLLLQGKKFSKSRGWYISLEDFLNEFPPDYLRFYLSSITTYSQHDVNFDWLEFQAKINNELVANIGNFVNRTLTFINTKFGGVVPDPEDTLETRSAELENELVDKIKCIAVSVGKDIESNSHDRALKKILEFSSACNYYLQLEEPWKNKNNKTCLYVCANACRTLSILLAPFLPFASEKINNMLNVKTADWLSASELKIKPGHKINAAEILFNKVEDGSIRKRLEKLGGAKELLNIEDFQKLDIRIGKVTSAENVPKSEKLLKLMVDIGNETRQCIAGMAKFYKAQDLIGKNVVVVVNLKPVKFMGLESQCMMLAAEKDGSVVLLKPDKDVGTGALIR
ncbi:MAG: methionine--tRNA ligase [Candidatus Aenigmarchaeota archaeon]|nr:methionine--tRNA ligase [Candidatus Aenigmarchaeota archaeon]